MMIGGLMQLVAAAGCVANAKGRLVFGWVVFVGNIIRGECWFVACGCWLAMATAACTWRWLTAAAVSWI